MMACPPAMRGCRRDCRHRLMVQEYRLAREAAEAARDAATLGYATERRAYGPIVTFKRWLVDLAGGKDEAAA